MNRKFFWLLVSRLYPIALVDHYVSTPPISFQHLQHDLECKSSDGKTAKQTNTDVHLVSGTSELSCVAAARLAARRRTSA
jgi:hypothetical protein